jgi:hypothetical protein
MRWLFGFSILSFLLHFIPWLLTEVQVGKFVLWR